MCKRKFYCPLSIPYAHTHMHACMHTCTHTLMHPCTHAHTPRTHSRMHAHMQAWLYNILPWVTMATGSTVGGYAANWMISHSEWMGGPEESTSLESGSQESESGGKVSIAWCFQEFFHVDFQIPFEWCNTLLELWLPILCTYTYI